MSTYRWHSRAVLVGATCLVVLSLIAFGVTSGATSSTVRFARESYGRLSGVSTLASVYNATLGFEKIFVISLPSRTDQRDAMSLAAALTGIDVEYVDGVTNVSSQALPVGYDAVQLNRGSLNAWRAHMNVARRIVEENIVSALVVEGDVDWDVNIRPQMRDFALASRSLLQPLVGTTDQFLDPTRSRPGDGAPPVNLNARDAAQRVAEPVTSPYGDVDRWHLFWLGHCGARFPRTSDGDMALGRAVIDGDETVPETQHLDVEYGSSELLREYPPHTRVVSAAPENTCTLAYAVTGGGARRLLYELSVHEMTGTNDMMFRSVCQGSDGHARATCLTVQPQLFQHHRPAGPKRGFSDINDFGPAINEHAYSRNIRWSTRLNFAQLLQNGTNYVDQFPDGQPKPAWLDASE